MEQIFVFRFLYHCKYYVDDDTGLWAFNNRQSIVNAGYDIYDRVQTTNTLTYGLKYGETVAAGAEPRAEQLEMKDLQVTHYEEYDEYGNALTRRVNREIL